MLGDIDRLESEANEVFNKLVLPTWGGELHGFVETLYGYMLRVFSHIDLLSSYWRGSNKYQSMRMVDFMDEHMSHGREAHSVAVQVWRHQLIHTAQPRPLKDPSSNKIIYWLLQWGDRHLPKEQHFTFSETESQIILNLGALYLIEDLRKSAAVYCDELSTSFPLQRNADTFASKLASCMLKEY